MNQQVHLPLLQPVPPAGEEARVNAIFQGIQERFGYVPDGVRLYGLSPALLENFLANIGYFMAHPRLGQKLLVMIRYLNSVQVNCTFCIDFNEAYLHQLGADIEHVRAARADINQAPVNAQELPLLRLALKGVENPDALNEADMAAARAEGWNDHDIFEVIALAASNRAFTTMLKAFKVEHQGSFA